MIDDMRELEEYNMNRDGHLPNIKHVGDWSG
jgi:hypothetical protein